MLMSAAVALGACGGGDDRATTTDSAAAAGEVSASGTAGSMGAMGDSAGAMAGGTGTAAGGVNTAALGGLDAPGIMGLVGASNAAEILTSEAVVDKAGHADVKAFARRMITEHRAMQKEADQLATQLNVTPGTPEPATQKAQMANQMATQLKSLQAGQPLDQQYIEGQVQAHTQTLAELQALQGNANAPAQVKAMIEKAIPKVQAHLQEAQQIQTRLGGATGTGTSGTGS